MFVERIIKISNFLERVLLNFLSSCVQILATKLPTFYDASFLLDLKNALFKHFIAPKSWNHKHKVFG